MGPNDHPPKIFRKWSFQRRNFNKYLNILKNIKVLPAFLELAFLDVKNWLVSLLQDVEDMVDGLEAPGPEVELIWPLPSDFEVPEREPVMTPFQIHQLQRIELQNGMFEVQCFVESNRIDEEVMSEADHTIDLPDWLFVDMMLSDDGEEMELVEEVILPVLLPSQYPVPDCEPPANRMMLFVSRRFEFRGLMNRSAFMRTIEEKVVEVMFATALALQGPIEVAIQAAFAPPAPEPKDIFYDCLNMFEEKEHDEVEAEELEEMFDEEERMPMVDLDQGMEEIDEQRGQNEPEVMEVEQDEDEENEDEHDHEQEENEPENEEEDEDDEEEEEEEEEEDEDDDPQAELHALIQDGLDRIIQNPGLPNALEICNLLVRHKNSLRRFERNRATPAELMVLYNQIAATLARLN